MSRRRTLEDTGLWKGLTLIQKVILITTNLSAACIVAVGVFMRYVLHKDFFGQEEIVTVVAMWLYWIGGVYGSYEDSHIQADVVNSMLKNEKIKKVLRFVVLIISVIVLAVWFRWSIDYVIWAYNSHAQSAGLKIPLILSQSALCVGFGGMLFYTIYHLYRTIRPIRYTACGQPEEEGGSA